MDDNMREDSDYYFDEPDDPELTGEFFEDNYRESYKENHSFSGSNEPTISLPKEEPASDDDYDDDDEEPVSRSGKKSGKAKKKAAKKDRKKSRKDDGEEGLKRGVMTNPVIRSVLKKNVTAADGKKTVTHGGVLAKTIYFLIVTAIGMAACIGLSQFVTKIPNLSEILAEVVIIEPGAFAVNATVLELLIFVASLALTLILAIVNIFARPLIPVTGTIYCLAEGYFLTFITISLKEEYRWIGIAALTLTILLVLIMLFLYKSGTVRLGGKILRIIFTIFLTVIIGGVLLFVMQFIPGLKVIAHGIELVMQNPAVSAAISVISIIIACLFLLADFEAIGRAVDNDISKKYEWQLAYGIAYAVLFLYLKILDLLIRIFAKEK